jgi:hypothetical protein
MFKRLLGLGVGALSLLTAACDNAPMTQSVYYNQQSTLHYLQYATIEGPLLVRVFGNPFVTGKDFLDRIVVEELENSVTFIKGVKMTPDPERAFHPEYRMIVVLGADKAVDANALCAGNDPRLDPPNTVPVRLVAVFCRRDELLSEVRGSIGPSASPEDPGFRRWMREIGKTLILPG